MQFALICIFKYLNQRIIRIDEQNGVSFKGVSKTNNNIKTKNEEIDYSRLSFFYCLPVLEKYLEKCLKMNLSIHFLSLFLSSSETDENSPLSEVTLKTLGCSGNGAVGENWGRIPQIMLRDK